MQSLDGKPCSHSVTRSVLSSLQLYQFTADENTSWHFFRVPQLQIEILRTKTCSLPVMYNCHQYSFCRWCRGEGGWWCPRENILWVVVTGLPKWKQNVGGRNGNSGFKKWGFRDRWGEDYHRTFPFPVVLTQDRSTEVQVPTQSCQVWQLISPPTWNGCSRVLARFCS